MPAAIVLAGILAWSNSLGGAFVFDDLAAIGGLQRGDGGPIRMGEALGFGSPSLTSSGRPLLALSLALNRAAGGLEPSGYHAFNLLVHVAAGLALFGLARRTLLGGKGVGAPTAAEATLVAGSVALLWTVHPLQTAAVTYVVQRGEVMAGLAFLLTLYGLARAAAEPWRRRWPALAFGACLAGMAAKETMAAAPVAALLYDRTFLAGSFREAWRLRRRLHAALASTWVLLAALVASSPGRGGTVGYDSAAAAWHYLLTQAEAIALYVRLAFWPHPLVFDYGMGLATSLERVALPAAAVVAALLLTAWALWRRPAAGFLGAAFFLALAPSSSVVPILTQTIAEHRMYLALAAVIAAVVWALWRWLGVRGLAAVPLLAAALGLATHARNEAYRTEESLWTDTVARRPENTRALSNLGAALLAGGRAGAAARCFDGVLARQPGHVPARYNLGLALLAMGRPDEAALQFRETLFVDPQHGEAHGSLAEALARTGRVADALPHFEAALQRSPGWTAARFGYGNAFAQMRRFAEAETQYRAVLAAEPAHTGARANLGNVLLVTGRIDEAVAAFEDVLRARPGDAAVRENLEQARALRAGPSR